MVGAARHRRDRWIDIRACTVHTPVVTRTDGQTDAHSVSYTISHKPRTTRRRNARNDTRNSNSFQRWEATAPRSRVTIRQELLHARYSNDAVNTVCTQQRRQHNKGGSDSCTSTFLPEQDVHHARHRLATAAPALGGPCSRCIHFSTAISNANHPAALTAASEPILQPSRSHTPVSAGPT